MSPRTCSYLAALAGLLVACLGAAGRARPPLPPPAKKEHKPLTNSVGMKLVLVPAGKFRMGSPPGEKERDAEETPHEVEISRPFYLGVTEVTQKQFKDVMGYHPSHFSFDGTAAPNAKHLARRMPAGGRGKLAGVASTADFPVENISWDEAVELCKKLTALPAEKRARRTYRLPTEAEWEYACRGGAASYQVFHTGDRLSAKDANFDGNFPSGGAAGEHLERPSKVGSYKPNKLGLYDMHGNVYEWCSDWWDKGYYSTSPRKDPAGPSKGTYRIIRGGGWDCSAGMCRSASRFAYEPHGRVITVGVRVVAVTAEK